ncbi:alginate lyase family protein [Aestuariivivens insulae]|uniref:alginate lyase family protein n=1 Tax=Aestuariivivens insulae TaxID=1621988 RepID=UPI001F573719|nr:alginate lyase family protein [Aestuariivivens insulae]
MIVIKRKGWIFLLGLVVFGQLFSQTKTIRLDNIFDELNLDTPYMEQVKECHAKNNSSKALTELLKVYRKKEDIYKRVSKEDIPYINENYLEDLNRSIKIADEVVSQYFVFREAWDMERTNIPYQFKKEIIWEQNPFGDPEWTYMLNRHKYWIHLGKAYFFTGKEKYAKAFINQVNHWIDHNPLPSLEDKYKNSAAWRRIEAGIRCENWIKAFEYIKNSKHVTPKFLAKFLKALYQHGQYIDSAFSNFSKTSNWGVLEYQGLFNVSVFLEDFNTAQDWQSNAIDRLTQCIALQVLEDGTHWEHSPMYHNEVFHCFMNVNLLSQRNNIKLPEILVQKTKAMAYANVGWQKPNYHQPLLGDSDDTDTRGLLSLAAYLYNDPVIKTRAYKTLDFEDYLIIGKEANENYKTIEPKEPSFLSKFQQSSGDFYMRTSWKEDATYTSLHLKKLAGGHAHEDLLSFTIYANGRDYLVDNGRYTYVDNTWRKMFKENRSHNGLGVDNLPNSILNGAWGSDYQGWTDGIYTKSNPIFDYGEAENTSYKRLEDPVSMKRRMLFLKPNVWLVFDSFSAKENHKYSQYFNFPNTKVQIKDQAIITTYNSRNLKIHPISDVELKLEDSWYSPEYNLKKESKRVEVYKNTKGFETFISLLYFPDTTNITYKSTPVYDRNDNVLSKEDAEAVTVHFDNKSYTLVVAYNSPTIANHFFVVDGKMIHGEIVLIEKDKESTKVYNIK